MNKEANMDTNFVKYTPGGKLVKHGGSGTAYANYGCRCDECKQANAERALRRRKARLKEEPPPGSHGKYTTYSNWGCRCEFCLKAGSEHNKKNYRDRKVKAS